MVRAPCCEKMGMKKGPWTPEEDQVLVDYINQYGHGNWRALPKHAGLLRCGKSCRLRWTNYLRPDIKRGNFSKEEEETVIELHGMLGNRWSAIAAKLPGRTDNEIKNVWHTHLKKRASLPRNEPEHDQRQASSESNLTTSAQQSCSDICDNNSFNESMISTIDNVVESPGYFPEIDESFWSEVLSPRSSENNYGVSGDIPANTTVPQYEYPFSPVRAMEPIHAACSNSVDIQDDMDFWYNVFKRSGEYFPDLAGF